MCDVPFDVANMRQVGVNTGEAGEGVAPGGVVAALGVRTGAGARLWEGNPWGFLPPPHPTEIYVIVDLGWYRRCKPYLCYWGWRWLATALRNMPITE